MLHCQNPPRLRLQASLSVQMRVPYVRKCALGFKATKKHGKVRSPWPSYPGGGGISGGGATRPDPCHVEAVTGIPLSSTAECGSISSCGLSQMSSGPAARLLHSSMIWRSRWGQSLILSGAERRQTLSKSKSPPSRPRPHRRHVRCHRIPSRITVLKIISQTRLAIESVPEWLVRVFFLSLA